MNGEKLVKRNPEELKPKEWVTVAKIGFQQQILTFLFCAYGFTLVVATIALFFQGFHLAGFVLEPSLLRTMETVTIGDVGGLLVITVRASFK
jgi:hypothetical protein